MEESRRKSHDLKSHDLKQLVADLSLEVHRFKKRPSQLSTGLSAQERSNVISRVEETRWGERKLLIQVQVPKSNYYRWRPVNNT